jgi:DegV family protein with EDD domain
MKIAVVTDIASVLNQKFLDMYENLRIVDIPYFIDNKEYRETSFERDEFYKTLEKSNSVHTSQPSIQSVLDTWDELLKDYEYIIHIPMSSALSSSYSTAQMLANEDEYVGKVFVLDLQRISFSQKVSTLEALEMIKEGFSAEEIANYLTKTKFDSSIYINVPNLKYLKNGGRLTKAVALIATLFSIKPVLQIQGGKLDMYKKTHSLKQSYDILVKSIKNDLETRFKSYLDNNELIMAIAYTNNYDVALKMKERLEREYMGLKVLIVDPLCQTISCHIGLDCLGVGVTRVRKEVMELLKIEN